MQTPRDSTPVSSHWVHNPSRKLLPGPRTLVTGQGSREVTWEPKPLAEQISGTRARAQPESESDGESGGSKLQLSPSHETDDIRQATKPQFLHLKQHQRQLTPMFWEIKPPICPVKVSPLPHSSLTTGHHVLWTQDRKVLRGHSGHWVCDQKQDLRM